MTELSGVEGMADGQPLKGVTVVELCHSIAGPYGASILAQLGAEVIKVENPAKGDDARAWGPPDWCGSSSVFQAMNRDKLGTTLNLKDDAECARLKAFIFDKADVVLQSLRPGAAEALGLGAQALRGVKPELIYCNLGAFGTRGPLREKPGYDPLMQARGGLMSVTGEDGREPVRVGCSIIDMGTGMWAAMGIVSALYRRAVSGQGCVVDTSLFESSIAWMTVHLTGYMASGEIRRPMGSGLVEIVPHQAFRTQDGYIMVAAGNDSLFRKLAAAMGCPELASDLRYATNNGRVANRDGLLPVLQGLFAGRSTAEWEATLDNAGVPAAPLQKVDQVLSDAQTQAMQMIQSVPGSEMTLVGLPLSFDGTRPPCRSAPPRMGQHNAVFAEADAAAEPKIAAGARA